MKRKSFIIGVSLAVVVAAGAFIAYRHFSGGSEKVSISQINEELKNYSFSNYNNLTFDCVVKNTTFDNVYSSVEITPYQISSDKNEYEKLKKKAADLINDVTNTDINAKYFDDDIIYREADFDHCIYDSGDIYADYYADGSFILNDMRKQNVSIENELSQQETIIKRFKATDDISSYSINIGGEDYNLSDAVKYADGFIADKLKNYLNKGDTPVLSDIAVINSNDFGGNAFVLRYSHTIDGIYVDDSFMSDLENDFLRGSYLQIVICKKDHISMIQNMYYYSVLGSDAIDAIIPLTKSVELLSQALAPYTKYTVTECELKYVCITNYKDNKIYMHPMWTFVIDERSSDEYEPGDDYFGKSTAYIDALTGEHYMFIPGQGLVK